MDPELDELIEHSNADLILTEDGAYLTKAGLQRLSTKPDPQEKTAENNS